MRLRAPLPPGHIRRLEAPRVPRSRPSPPVAHRPRVGRQVLAEGEVQVDGAAGGPVRTSDGEVDIGEEGPGRDGVRRAAHVFRVPRICPEDPGLHNRLVGATVAKLRGAIGRQENHRDPLLRRLDNRGEQVSHSRAGRDDDRGRETARFRVPDGVVPRRSLVVLDAGRGRAVPRDRHRQRRRPGARADNEVRHAAPAQLLDDHRGPERVDVRQLAQRGGGGAQQLEDRAHLVVGFGPLGVWVRPWDDPCPRVHVQRPRLAQHRADADGELAGDRGHEAHGPAVEPSVEPLLSADELGGDGARLAAHRRRRVQRLEQPDERLPILIRGTPHGADSPREMLDVPQLQHEYVRG
mmetsp:Transcript_3527/g.7768  ORF Transcript_3527/g.7768 Transcript_3527/m.7768 type:complete len:351 (+) Transcript_3527:480-1532(+)